MSSHPPKKNHVPIWRNIQKDNFRVLEDLAAFLELSPEKRAQLINRPSFPLNLPRRLAEKIRKNTLDDPILKQFVPLQEELHVSADFREHPTEDLSFCKTPKLLQKYEGRALIITTGACAMHCRFCFRQNYPYSTADKSFDEELAVLAQDPSITEVILSGGDPLSLSDEHLRQLIKNIEAIPHIKLLRFHSRFPIGIPERITDTLLEIFQHSSLQIIFVSHVNHSIELDQDVCAALKRIHELGIPLLNSTVLLKDVNDDVNTLTELNLALVQNGIIPYYLNQLDRVQGGAHFEVDQTKGILLHEELRKRLPGYAVPRYIQEIAGQKYKTPLT